MAHDTFMVVLTHQGHYTILNYEEHQRKSVWYKHNVKKVIERDMHYPEALKLWHTLNQTESKEREDYNG